ncbi:signal transduction histidine kinase [Flavobacterium sp. CG_23.5]|uniref:tetratricopeptide repeat-containing sensor histidine kinase n=1 Tax=unclassified Flavobacterium TaxID=196869 RepID=UPI0018CB4CB5|nr:MULTISPECIES: tetratricopeptide repeat-containing sensor histidine kinase [unclassified Flavobacterium]MBG6112043.1 signal transduction histidine kinase [Flavobacterium sp. CG_9.10]MBP2282747.1 signal transduction histidine kinase [Flavobacterium sp. CG_23.5]
MVRQKSHFPVFILLLLLILSFQSCEKKTQHIPKKNHNVAAINRLIDLGDKYFESGKYDSSYYYFLKAKSICDPKKDQSKIIYVISNLATIQQNQGDYSGSEATAMEAFPILETTTNPKYKWNIYTILGLNYLNTLDNKTALYYFSKALNLKTDAYRKNGTKNNIALVHIENENYKKAIQILIPMTSEIEVIKDSINYIRTISNIGYCYNKMSSPKAFYYLNRSLKIRLQIKDELGIVGSYYNLSTFYKKSNPNLAIAYAKLAYEKTTRYNAVDDRLKCLEQLIQISSSNQIKKYSLDYIRINDSIHKIRQNAKNQFAKIKYDSKKERDENLKLKSQKVKNELQLEQQKNKTLILFLIVGIIIAFTGFIYYYLVTKHKRENIKTSYNTEVRIAKKLHDELANDVYQAMAFAETQDLSTADNKEILLNNLDNIYSRTRNISRKNSTIETGLSFIPNLKEMMSGFNTTAIHVLINGLDIINWSVVEDTKKITVYRILQELLVNMKKHSKSSLVLISFKKNDKKIQIDYSDNGVGATLEELNFKKGLQNVENRILAIKGTITFDTKSGKGFKVNILFPL